MYNISIRLYSREPHISQIMTGFCMLERSNKKKYKINIAHYTGENKGAFVEVVYRGKKIIYDVLDGYQDLDSIRDLLNRCDFYFKRSYSADKNRIFSLHTSDRMYPLGFNYHVSCSAHPIDKPYWKELIKSFLGIENNMYSNTYFSTKRFEENPKYKTQGIKVLFATRLWGRDESLPEKLNEEREYINSMRLSIIKSLREIEEIEFIGGVSDSALSRKIAPELIMPKEMTTRRSYIKLLHSADICIGSMGLHESIGWKTGEYVAAAKAVVNEAFHYEVPGNFCKEKNYFEFTNAQECIEAVKILIANPDKLYEMKLANQQYYCKYLRPDSLIRNTLKIVDASIDNSHSCDRK